MTDRLKYVTTWRDRHGKRRYFFRARGQKYPLPGAPGESDFHTAYAHYLAELEANTLGRRETAFIAGTIGRVIEDYLKHPAFTGKAGNTQRNYRRVLDHLKMKLGAARIADLQPNHIRIVRDEIAKTSTATADIATMLLGVLWDHAGEFCRIPLGVNPARGLRKVHVDKKPHAPWPVQVISDFLKVASPQLQLALNLLLYSGQRVSDVTTMRWSDFADGRMRLVQEKTREPIDVKVHARLAAVLKEVPRINDYVLNNRWGRPYKNADALSGVIKRVLTDDLENAAHLTTHGLRKNAGVALAEAGCTVPEIQAILGHKTPQMALHYVKEANKVVLADRANRKRERAGAA
jgi:integrase